MVEDVLVKNSPFHLIVQQLEITLQLHLRVLSLITSLVIHRIISVAQPISMETMLSSSFSTTLWLMCLVRSM